MTKKIVFSKLDKFLKFMIFSQKRFSIKNVSLSVYEAVERIFKVLESYQKNVSLKLLLEIIFIFFAIIFSLPIVIFTRVLIVFISFFTSVFALLLSLTYGTFYGFFPWLIINPNLNSDLQSKVNVKVPTFQSYDKLLYPLTWSWDMFNQWGKNLVSFAFRPFNKIKQLNIKMNETHIIERMYLSLSLIFSSIIYLTFSLIITQSIFLVLIVLSASTFGLLHFFISIFKRLIIDKLKEEDELEIIEDEGAPDIETPDPSIEMKE
jgi:hypothetical protein